jgi:protein-S-isoprenylcysteine O-methyltransferase Ste14
MVATAVELRRTALRHQVLFLPFLALVLFAPAGSLRFWQGWLFAFVFMSSSIAIGLYFSKHDPKLIERRMKAGPSAEKEASQKVIIFLVMVTFVLLVAVPGLDYRWHWSQVPLWLVLTADAGIVLSFIVFFVVITQNSYAAANIRVEADQPVVSTGLYGIVRHPMYAGALPLLLCTPLALGSYWGMLIAVASFPVLAWRLLEEEKFLSRNLPGYQDYCRQVRYRLIPRIW